MAKSARFIFSLSFHVTQGQGRMKRAAQKLLEAGVIDAGEVGRV
jgi:hypothetical protein